MEEIEENKTKKKVKESVVQKVEVTTATAPAFQLPDGQIVSTEDYLVWMGNSILELKKGLL